MAQRYSSDPKQRARELVRDGKIGGARPGAGRPRKQHTAKAHPRPAAARIAELAAENADEIAAVAIDVLLSKKATHNEKVRAIRALVGIEQREAALEVAEISEPPPQAALPATRSGMEAELARMLTDPIVRDRFLALLSPA